MSPRPIKSALGDRWRSARASIAGSALVVAYHRVADLASDPQRLAVGVEQFGEQMEVVSKSYNPMAAGELLELVARRKRIPSRSVVVTIDDGYSDALLMAKPILASCSVPASVFVSSDYLAGDKEFWWDEIERVVLCANALPSRLVIEAGGTQFTVDTATESRRDDQRETALEWDITQPATTERQRLYLQLRDLLLPLSATERESALASLRAQFRVERLVRPTYRPLSASELRELADGELVEVGAHTKSHQMLAVRTQDEQQDEILGAKLALEEATGRPVRLFSYPYGSEDSYSEVTERIVREAGFLGAFTTRFGIVLPWANRFGLPRCPTENIGGEEFAKRLDRWSEMAR